MIGDVKNIQLRVVGYADAGCNQRVFDRSELLRISVRGKNTSLLPLCCYVDLNDHSS